MWISLGITSALFLGVYDVFKKWSVRENNVVLVLFLSTCFGAVMTLPVYLLSRLCPDAMTSVGLFAATPAFPEHIYILSKAVLVSISWIAAFFALKHLPISIVSPIRASAPLWTLIGALLIFGEQLKPLHWAAVSLIFISYYIFSLIGRKEGIAFTRNRWMLLVFVATLTGALSALYDKYLLHNIDIGPVTLQAWFSFYLVAVNGGVYLLSRRMTKHNPVPFEWRFTIPLIGIFLIVADYLYFRALSNETALIAVLSVIRRSSVVISFLVGGLIFKERNKRIKLLPLFGVLSGVALLLVE
jgi:transporter family protein